MSVDGTAAAAKLLSFTNIKGGYCLYYVWQAYKAVGASTGRSAGTALEAWNKSEGRHPGDRNPPAGVPVFWGAKPSSSAGDVVISLGGGRVAATDYPRYGVVGICTIAERERQIGRPYLGWAERIFDQAIRIPQATSTDVSPIAHTLENDMSKPVIIAYSSSGHRNGISLAGPGYWHKFTAEEWEHINALKGSDGRPYLAGIPVITPINDRSYDLYWQVFVGNQAEKGGEISADQVQALVAAVKAAAGTAQVDVVAIAKAVNDDAAKRLTS